jgi:hypothetical protein
MGTEYHYDDYNIQGGSISGTPIGQDTPDKGAFTELKASLVEMKKGGDIASASPLAIDTDGDYFDVTGTTGFASMTVAANRHFFLQFDGILTMTHHATNLDLPRETNITTAVGDVGEFFSTGANTVQCVNYTRASSATAFEDIKQAASTTATGVSERATDAEALTGTDTERHITPANLTAVLSRGINLIGTAGEAGFAVGICPSQLLPDGMISLPGYDQPSHDNYGNYLYKDGSIMCWIPKFYYLIATNNVTIKGMDTYATEQDANADNYAMPRAFIDGGIEQQGFFFDKYMCSQNAWGSGQIASSIKNGLPLSTAAVHNPIAGLTACTANQYYETIKAAHARDGVDGAENASSIFHCASKFQYAALALLFFAHAQASSATTYCAWYDATYNYPKGCNNNALKDYDEVSNGAGSGDDLLYVTDGYSNCGKTGSGVPFAKSTHNGQNCGVADLNGLMYEISIGLTAVATSDTIEDISRANPANVQETGHVKSTGDYMMLTGIEGGDWAALDDKIYKVTKIDANNYTLDGVDTSGFAQAYAAGTNHGTTYAGTFYLAKEATAMKDFDSNNAGATDHWGATGVAAMMDAFTPVFESAYAANGFAQRFGSGANQVLSEAMSGDAWLLTGLGFPKDADGIDVTGTNAFGKDYFYQYIRNELCGLSCGDWDDTSNAGVWCFGWYNYRTRSSSYVGFRLGLYTE